jgi:hypothetical protein
VDVGAGPEADIDSESFPRASLDIHRPGDAGIWQALHHCEINTDVTALCLLDCWLAIFRYEVIVGDVVWYDLPIPFPDGSKLLNRILNARAPEPIWVVNMASSRFLRKWENGELLVPSDLDPGPEDLAQIDAAPESTPTPPEKRHEPPLS